MPLEGSCAHGPVKVVISQPMFFPWVGLFEQIKLADIYVHYVDAQFSKGSFVNRVQIKTPDGQKWLTVPLDGLQLGQNIENVDLNQRFDWKRQHLEFLAQSYAKAPFRSEMLDLVKRVYGQNSTNIADLAVNSVEEVCKYFGIGHATRFLFSRDLNVSGKGSQRVLDMVMALKANVYITGHGAKNYLAHEIFERSGIRVEYMNYCKTPYPQLHGPFTPFVSILDLVANMGQRGSEIIHSGTVHWKEFMI